MQQLPKGYYAVQADFANAPKDRFTFGGVTYAVTEGENLFGSIIDANAHATDVPETVLPGLSYESFTTPVILFSAGQHSIDRFVCNRSITILGQKAGINPNLPAEDRLELPPLNPERGEGESMLKGGYDYGNMVLTEPSVETVIFDGFLFRKARFRDLRNDGCHTMLAFRNIIQEGPTGKMLFMAVPAKASGNLHREMYFENMRVVGYDDCDYGGMLFHTSAEKLVIDNLCYADNKQMFGFTTRTRSLNNASGNCEISEYIIKNSYLRNLLDDHGIATGCCGVTDRGVVVSAYNTVFVNASRENEGVFQPHFNNEKCEVNLVDCTIVDTRGNSSAVVTPFGAYSNVTLCNTTIEGFAELCKNLPIPPTNAPDQIENREQDWQTLTLDAHTVVGTAKQDFSALDARYEGTRAYYGDTHVHTNCGGTSDGKTPMSEYVAKMDENGLDFVAIVDHRQMRGFFLPEWDDERFIIGTEPGTKITEGLNACMDMSSIHYNMLFPHKYGLAMVLANFPEFEFRGDELTGSFKYPTFTKERFCELTKYVQSIGGIMVHPHPKELLASRDPLDFYYGEHTFIETFHIAYHSHCSFRDYRLWVDLLALGKHVYQSAGSDSHGAVPNIPFSVFYTKERKGRAFFDRMHEGDFTSGGAGFKMCIDGQGMGAELTYREGMRLTLRVDDFSPKIFKENTAYELRVITDKGVAYASTFNGKQPQAVELEVQDRAFYRAEIYDLTNDCFVAIGNPIWLDGATYNPAE